jgi:uncharacterized protein
MLKVSVDALQQGPIEMDLDLDPAELDLSDKEFSFPGPVRGHLTFKLIGDDVESKGRVSVDAVAPCARCLEPARYHLEAPVHQMWLHRDPGEDALPADLREDTLAEYYRGQEVEAGGVLRELLLSELPDVPHCAEDCKGLCPKCGANLNREACRCPDTVGAEEEVSPATSEWKRQLMQIKQRKS